MNDANDKTSAKAPNPIYDHREDPEYCGAPYPNGDLFCVKPPGHPYNHATLLGIHPEHEDGHGVLWPAQEEWDEWA